MRQRALARTTIIVDSGIFQNVRIVEALAARLDGQVPDGGAGQIDLERPIKVQDRLDEALQNKVFVKQGEEEIFRRDVFATGAV
mgnify:CR=1 FL=1